MRLLPLVLLLGCAVEFRFDAPTVEGLRAVVPGPGLPEQAVPMDANNNLDIIEHEGRWFLAYRSAPSHFASADARIYVVSSTDRETWEHEATFGLDTDLREPQLVSWNGELRLYFAVLGTDLLNFEPQGTRVSLRNAQGDWQEHVDSGFGETFIPWRIKPVDGRLQMFGYSGGENVYNFDERQPIEVSWLVSEATETWEPFVPGQPVVLSGGGSETDLVTLDDGSHIAVVRNEAGDEEGFGSLICRAESDAPGDWECRHDPRKYDSPLLFKQNNKVWLIARRNVTDTGHYDLGDSVDATEDDPYLAFQWDYWHNPKRCAVWAVDPERLEVHHALDLPSRGDTCFPEMVRIDANRLLVYNYSSDVNGPDLDWLDGQTGETLIYEQFLVFP